MNNGRWLFLGVVALFAVLSVAVVLPYVQFVSAAVLVAFVLHPLHRRLAARYDETRLAIGLVTLSMAALVGPFIAVTALVANDARRFLTTVQEADAPAAFVEEPVADYTGVQIQLDGVIRSALGGVEDSVFGGAVTAIDVATHLLVGIGLFLFLLFYLVRDGGRLLAWLTDVSPIRRAATEDLLDRFRSLTNAVLLGHLLIAVIQAAVAGLGLFAVGIPNTLFWTFVMILLGLIPIIGTFAVWAPASLYLFWAGDSVAAAALFAYGFVVVGLTDEYLRPILVDRYAEVSPAIILVGVLGGLSAFGVMGLFVGPIVVGALKETVEVYSDHYGRQ